MWSREGFSLFALYGFAVLLIFIMTLFYSLLQKEKKAFNISIGARSSALVVVSGLPDQIGNRDGASCQRSRWCCRTPNSISPLF